jgi:hypothetical protein
MSIHIKTQEMKKKYNSMLPLPKKELLVFLPYSYAYLYKISTKNQILTQIRLNIIVSCELAQTDGKETTNE